MRLGVLILAVLAATPAAAQRPGQIAPAPAPAPVQQDMLVTLPLA